MTHNILVLIYYYFYWLKSSKLFLKWLNLLINSTQNVVYFEIYFSSEKFIKI